MEIKINNLDDMRDNRTPRKQEIEQILVDYGVAFTDALAERLDRYMEKEMSDFWQREKVDNPQGKGIEDLCEYFGGAKDILKSREDFKAWLECVKRHIRKAEELYEKYEYKKELCDDAISRQAVLNGLASIAKARVKSDAQKSLMGRVMFFTEHLPPVTPQPKTGHWIRQDNTKKPLYGWYFCSECNSVIGDKTEFCSNCGAKMESEE